MVREYISGGESWQSAPLPVTQQHGSIQRALRPAPPPPTAAFVTQLHCHSGVSRGSNSWTPGNARGQPWQTLSGSGMPIAMPASDPQFNPQAMVVNVWLIVHLSVLCFRSAPALPPGPAPPHSSGDHGEAYWQLAWPLCLPLCYPEGFSLLFPRQPTDLHSGHISLRHPHWLIAC